MFHTTVTIVKTLFKKLNHNNRPKPTSLTSTTDVVKVVSVLNILILFNQESYKQLLYLVFY